jgi:hypothetical protein
LVRARDSRSGERIVLLRARVARGGEDAREDNEAGEGGPFARDATSRRQAREPAADMRARSVGAAIPSWSVQFKRKVGPRGVRGGNGPNWGTVAQVSIPLLFIFCISKFNLSSNLNLNLCQIYSLLFL